MISNHTSYLLSLTSKLLAILATLILLFLLSHDSRLTTQAFAATYYIAPNKCEAPYNVNCNTSGSDTNSGLSPSQAWKNFTKAWQVLQPGDTLILLNGIYTQTMTPTSRGTASQPIIIRAANDGMAVVNARNTDGTVGYAAFNLSNHNLQYQPAYQIIEGINFSNASRAIDLNGVDHITFRRIHAYNQAYTFDELDNCNSSTCNEPQHPIRIGTRSSNVLIEDCVTSGYGSKMLKVIRSNATIRRCITDWRWFNAHTDHNSWPWNGGLNIYHNNNSIFENVVAFGNIAPDYAVNFHGLENSGQTTPVDGNQYLGVIAVNTGFTDDGMLQDFGPVRPHPMLADSAWPDKLIRPEEWSRRRVGFVIDGGIVDTLFQDILSFGNAGLGFSISGRLDDYSQNNVVRRGTFAGNGKHALNYDGGPGTQINFPSWGPDFSIYDSYVEGNSSHQGEGARLRCRYIDGILTTCNPNNSADPNNLWPWPMEDRIRHDLGYSVTNRVAAITQELFANGHMPYQIESIPDQPRPLLGTDVTYLPFPKANIGSASTATLTIKNPGNATLSVADIDIVNDMKPNAFSRLSGSGSCPQSTPFSIASGGSCTIVLRFAPTQLTYYPGRIRIFPGNMGAVAYPHMVSILGTGHDPQKTVSLPGRLRAENYSDYHDNTSVNRNRIAGFDDGVDVRAVRDGEDHGFSISWINSGEWLEFPVNIQQAGNYTLVTRFSSASTRDKQFRVILNGDTITTIQPYRTANWRTFEDLITQNINLPSGNHTLRIHFDTGDFELRHIDFMLDGSPIPTNTPFPTPTPHPADRNNDGIVNIFDLNHVISQFTSLGYSVYQSVITFFGKVL